MTFSNFRNLGASQPNAAGTGMSFNFASIPQINDILCVAAVFDNTTASTPTATLDTSFWPAGQFTLLDSISVNSPTATSGGGVRAHVWLYRITATWSSALSAQITLDASKTARAATGILVGASGPVTVQQSLFGSSTGTGSQFKSAPASGGALSGELQFVVAATEQNVAVTFANSPDISATAVSATGGGSAANAAVTLAAKVYDDAGISAITTTVSDGSATWASVVEAGVSHTVTPTDNLGLTDTPVYVMTMIRADIEDLGLTDSAVMAQTHNFNRVDNLGLTDSATVGFQRAVAQTDNMGLTDSASVILGVSHSVNQTDNLGLTDSATATLVVALTASPVDNMGLTDSAVVTLGKVYSEDRSDNLGLTDTVEITLIGAGGVGTPGIFASGAPASSTSSTTRAFTLPASIPAGSTLWFASNINQSAATVSSVANVTETIVDTIQVGASLSTVLMKAPVGPSDSGNTVTITWSANGKSTVAWIIVTGVDFAEDLVTQALDNIVDTAATLPSITPTAANELLLNFVCGNGAAATNILTPDVDWTFQAEAYYTGAAPIQSTHVFTKQLATGAGVPRSGDVHTWDTDFRDGIYVVGLKPATVGSGGSYIDFMPSPDLMGLSDSVTVDLGAAPDAHTVDQTDNLGLTDAFTIQVGRTITTIDSLGLTDSAVISIPLTVNISDTMGLFDGTVETSNDLAQVDNLGLTDSSTRVMDHGLVRTDNLGLTDAVTLVMGQGYVKSNDEELYDEAVVALGMVVPTSDNLGLTDSVVVENGKSVQQVDSLGLTDTQTMILSMSFPKSDNLGLTDSATVNKINGVNQTDNLGLTDSIVAVGSWKHNQTDAMGLTDAATVTMSGASSLDQVDNLGLTDSVVLAHTDIEPRSDNLGLTDSVVAGRSMAVAPTDALGLTDTFTVTVTANVVPADNMGLTDSFTVAMGLNVVRVDAEGLTDLSVRAEEHARNQLDNMGLTDTVFIQMPRTSVVSDSLGLTDSVSVAQRHAVNRSDTMTLTDSPSVIVGVTGIFFEGWGIPI